MSAHFGHSLLIIMICVFGLKKYYRWTDHLHIVLVYVASCVKESRSYHCRGGSRGGPGWARPTLNYFEI